MEPIGPAGAGDGPTDAATARHRRVVVQAAEARLAEYQRALGAPLLGDVAADAAVAEEAAGGVEHRLAADPKLLPRAIGGAPRLLGRCHAALAGTALTLVIKGGREVKGSGAGEVAPLEASS